MNTAAEDDILIMLDKEELDALEVRLAAILDNPPENILDPIKRLCGLVDSSRPHNVSTRVPLKRFCDMLDDVYKMAQIYAEENVIDKAFVFYLRFLGIAVEELGKHADYENMSNELRLRFCRLTVTAINSAEALKRQIKKNFDNQAQEYRLALEVRKQLRPEISQNADLLTPPTIFGNLKSYTTCDRHSSSNFMFQRIILPNNLPDKFLLHAEKASKGNAFGRIYGKLLRNNIIASHIVMTNGNDEKLENVEKIIAGDPSDDGEPNELILVGGVCHSLNDPPMQEFISLSLLTEIVCIIVPKEAQKSCVIHLNNLPERRKNGKAFPAELCQGFSSSANENPAPKPQNPISSSSSSEERCSEPNSLQLHHRSMCKHVHITPTLGVILMSSQNDTNTVYRPPEKYPKLN